VFIHQEKQIEIQLYVMGFPQEILKEKTFI